MNHSRNLVMEDGPTRFLVPTLNIMYLKAEHIYVRVFIRGQKSILIRKSLKSLLSQLPSQQFIQTHRSFVINSNHVSHWDNRYIYIAKDAIPISRYKWKSVSSWLTSA